jgi:hypothetical protein
VAILREAMLQDRGAFDWRREPYEFESERLAIDLLLGRPELRPMIEAGASVEEMELAWADGLAEFVALRETHLLYRE